MRKLVTLAAVAAVGFVLYRKAQEQREEQQLWASVTDPVPPMRRNG
ncbi:hypothetical protein KEM60_00371 [Austwickia sp. TVS 96-490-7B]|nr:DLW-39 family protein [Austwickia sp. TVS 96-490-7B]MBW3084186.1 hypothetical protein [Austwickia sp. TVS 96-490-7B]